MKGRALLYDPRPNRYPWPTRPHSIYTVNSPDAEVQAAERPGARNRPRIIIGATCLTVVACAAAYYFPGRDGDALWTLEPGSGTLDGAQPEWGACALSMLRYTGVCAENVYLMARVTVKTKSGGTASRISQLNGYLADLSDPTRVRIVFTET